MKVIIPCHRADGEDVFYLIESICTFDPGKRAEYVLVLNEGRKLSRCASAVHLLVKYFHAELISLKFLLTDAVSMDNAVFLHVISSFDEFILLWPDQLMVGQDAWLRRMIEARAYSKLTLPVYALSKGDCWSRNGIYAGKTLRAWPLVKYLKDENGSPIPFDKALAACFFDLHADYAAGLPEVEAFEKLLAEPVKKSRAAVRDIFQRHALISGTALPAIRDALLYAKKRTAAPLPSPGFATVRHQSMPPSRQRKSRGDKLLSQKKAVPLDDWQDAFSGQRCFLICNGPSLRKTNLAVLRNEYTFGLNRIYLNYERMGFQPTFYACVNPNLARQFAYDLNQLRSLRFFESSFMPYIQNAWNSYFLQHDSSGGLQFFHDLRQLAWHQGWTVTFCAMQVAYYLGFQEVILVGCDHYFSVSGKPNKTVVAHSADANHFHPDYFGKGVVWDHPDLESSEQAYRLAKEIYARGGRAVFDATICGHLTVFPKLKLAKLQVENERVE
jgi:hypothetical protein